MPRSIFLCRADDRTIGLDLARGRYFARHAGSSIDEDGRLSIALLDLPPATAPSTDARCRWFAAWGAILVTRMVVHVLPFRFLIALAGWISTPGGSRPVRSDLDALVRDYRFARRMLPLSRKCLPDSLSLLIFLRCHGWATELVIGVTGHPFSAHSWVQTPDYVLSDVAGQLRRRIPILSSLCLADI